MFVLLGALLYCFINLLIEHTAPQGYHTAFGLCGGIEKY